MLWRYKRYTVAISFESLPPRWLVIMKQVSSQQNHVNLHMIGVVSYQGNGEYQPSAFERFAESPRRY